MSPVNLKVYLFSSITTRRDIISAWEPTFLHNFRFQSISFIALMSIWALFMIFSWKIRNITLTANHNAHLSFFFDLWLKDNVINCWDVTSLSRNMDRIFIIELCISWIPGHNCKQWTRVCSAWHTPSFRAARLLFSALFLCILAPTGIISCINFHTKHLSSGFKPLTKDKFFHEILHFTPKLRFSFLDGIKDPFLEMISCNSKL